MALGIGGDAVNERTRTYLRGRFRDYYRRNTPRTDSGGPGPVVPPAATSREWAYIPFAAGTGTPMVRHRELVDPDDLVSFLTGHRPRHVYHSTATYEHPAASSMAAKGWLGADLVFDLDADHLEDTDPDRDSYETMLSRCKDETVELLGMLERGFDFDDVTVVFSGNRGYHVHVRDPGVRTLDRAARKELVSYVRGIDLSFDALVVHEPVAASGGTVARRRLHTDAGWGRIVHDRLMRFLAGLKDRPRAAAVEELQTFRGIGPERADRVLQVVQTRWNAIEAGEIDLHQDFVRFLRSFIDERVAGTGPAIDDPVTTDIHRLIRLPGSLHGKTGLVVRPIERDRVADFAPLDDAIAPMFAEQTIDVEVLADYEVYLGGETWSVSRGQRTVPEFVGIFLMAREVAEKVRE